MIKQIFENEFEDFINLMAEVECGNHFDYTNEKHMEWLKKRISIYFYRGTKFFAYYTDGKTPAGFVSVLLDDGPEGVRCFGQKSELLDIALFQGYRKKGFGSELLAFAEEYSRQNGAYCMYVSTYVKNIEAINFYKKSGFEPVAVLPDVHGPDDEGMIYMRKLL